MTYLRNSYPDSMRDAFPCQFSLFSSGDLVEVGDIPTTLSLFLYRVTMNEHLRNAGRVNGDKNVPLALDLHYLMTVWASSAEAEHSILAWAMRQLYSHSVLDLSSLSSEAAWGADDLVQLIPAELSNEDIMRIWDAVNPPYRLSVSYIARVVRIDPDTETDSKPVVATRFSVMDREAAP